MWFKCNNEGKLLDDNLIYLAWIFVFDFEHTVGYLKCCADILKSKLCVYVFHSFKPKSMIFFPLTSSLLFLFR